MISLTIAPQWSSGIRSQTFRCLSPLLGMEGGRCIMNEKIALLAVYDLYEYKVWQHTIGESRTISDQLLPLTIMDEPERERAQVAAQFLLQSPPGEINDVLNGMAILCT